jgi:hypothetical protein
LRILDKMRMPLFGCGEKAALFAGPSDRWADAVAFVMIWPIHELLVETKRNLGAVSFKASTEVSVQRPSVSDLKT